MSFKTRHPNCGGKLVVVRVTAQIKLDNAPLEREGFDLWEYEDQTDTSDEVVKCLKCGKEFPLADVTE